MVKKIKKQSNESDNEYEIDENEDNFIDDDFDEDIDEDKINDTDDIIEQDTEINYNKYNINEDYEYSDYDDYENEPSKSNINLLSKDKRISSNRLTKYEMVRILGERTKQLTMGAKPIVKNYENLSYEKIAEEEFKLNMVPFKIKRYLPNNKYELWTLDELQKEHLLSQLE
jgi:DNA-directed RNA polymerase I, II, and III subunit RPABC2